MKAWSVSFIPARVSALIGVLVVTGCSSASTPSTAANDAGGATPDAGGTTPKTDAGPIGTPPDSGPVEIVVDAGPACNALAAAAPLVNYSLSDQGAPAALTGGTIADGTYYLTSYTIYGAGSVGQGFTAGQATSVTLDVAGTTWTQVQVFSIQNTMSTVSTNFTVALSGTALTLTPSCPQNAPATNATYEATPTALQIVLSTGGFTVSELFAKQ